MGLELFSDGFCNRREDPFYIGKCDVLGNPVESLGSGLQFRPRFDDVALFLINNPKTTMELELKSTMEYQIDQFKSIEGHPKVSWADLGSFGVSLEAPAKHFQRIFLLLGFQMPDFASPDSLQMALGGLNEESRLRNKNPFVALRSHTFSC